YIQIGDRYFVALCVALQPRQLGVRNEDRVVWLLCAHRWKRRVDLSPACVTEGFFICLDFEIGVDRPWKGGPSPHSDTLTEDLDYESYQQRTRLAAAQDDRSAGECPGQSYLTRSSHVATTGAPRGALGALRFAMSSMVLGDSAPSGTLIRSPSGRQKYRVPPGLG